jgi:hypothetical protein
MASPYGCDNDKHQNPDDKRVDAVIQAGQEEHRHVGHYDSNPSGEQAGSNGSL